MVHREHLKVHGLRAYEVGRLRSASRVALVLVPVAALCLVEARGRATCAGAALLLLAAAVFLRWRHRRGLESVTIGLQAGALPLVTGLVLDRFDLQCGLAGGSTFCTAFAVLVGIGSGLFIGAHASSWHARLYGSLTAGGIAALSASLGCVRLGVFGVASVLAGIGIGIAVASFSSRSRHARP